MRDRGRPASSWTIPLVFSVLYGVWAALHWPRFFYAPETRELFWYKPEGIRVMGWYGRLTMAAIAGIALGAILAVVASRFPESWRRAGPWVAAIATVASLIFIAVRQSLHWIV